jgi:NAD(P)-dependent dehydrogenase (short-subunit alcohol dehydrogenase family)
MANTSQKTVLITGSNSGIGAATAKFFIEKGWNVAATMRNLQKAPSWMNCENCGTFRLDVTSETSITEAISQVIERFRNIDVLVNNAGYGLKGPLEGITPEQLERQFATNVFGLINVTKHVTAIMREQGGGTIVNISSIGGRIAFPFTSAYHATKFAIEGLSESLRFELQPFNIRIKLIEPGGIKTDFVTRSQEWAKHPAYEQQMSKIIHLTARLNNTLPGPEGVAKVIYKASTDSSNKLRYLVKTGPYLKVNAILPDTLWRSLVGSVLR